MPAPRFMLAATILVCTAPAMAQTSFPVSSADWILQGDQTLGIIGGDVAAAGDVNGDGYDDVAIGDASYDGAFMDSGRMLVFAGTAAGPSLTPTWTLEGAAAGAGLSRAARAGDVNGDGLDDLVARSGQGFALYLGSAGGPVPAPWTTNGTFTVHGDVNGDGFGDLVVFSDPAFSIFNGSAAGLQQTPSATLPLPADLYRRFISAAVDDFNGDGRADLAYTWRYCGGKHCLFLNGQLRVHMGSDKGLSSQAKRSIDFGRERVPIVVAAGDADGDGFADAAVNDYADAASGHGPPATYLLRGGKSGLPSQAGSPAISGLTGFLVFGTGESAGDIDGDSFADYILVQEDSNDPAFSGTLSLIFSGGPGGYSQAPTLIVTPEQEGAGLGSTSAGDVNGDGLDDLLFSAPRYYITGFQRVGRVYVVLGRSVF